jgi:hypothetical protein
VLRASRQCRKSCRQAGGQVTCSCVARRGAWQCTWHMCVGAACDIVVAEACPMHMPGGTANRSGVGQQQHTRLLHTCLLHTGRALGICVGAVLSCVLMPLPCMCLVEHSRQPKHRVTAAYLSAAFWHGTWQCTWHMRGTHQQWLCRCGLCHA